MEQKGHPKEWELTPVQKIRVVFYEILDEYRGFARASLDQFGYEVLKDELRITCNEFDEAMRELAEQNGGGGDRETD